MTSLHTMGMQSIWYAFHTSVLTVWNYLQFLQLDYPIYNCTSQIFTDVQLTIYTVYSRNIICITLLPVMNFIKEIFNILSHHLSMRMTLFNSLGSLHIPQTIAWLLLSIQNVAVSVTVSYHHPYAQLSAQPKNLLSHLKSLIVFPLAYYHQSLTCLTLSNKYTLLIHHTLQQTTCQY